jgi:hypothetical protein
MRLVCGGVEWCPFEEPDGGKLVFARRGSGNECGSSLYNQPVGPKIWMKVTA